VRKLTAKNRKLIIDRAAEAAREGALLWFVFSALDALINGRLTLLWWMLNTAGSVMVWTLGMYSELRAKERP
jgi:hypothetical protein